MDGGHEAVAVGVEEDRAFSAERFGNEEGAVVADQGGGMKLDELGIAQDCAGTSGEAQAVGGCVGGIGRGSIEGARAAGREQDGVGQQRLVLVGDRTDAAAGVDGRGLRPSGQCAL